ncbi:hypothetical protein PENTCL1PPCAC_16404 [Pristionchus entomophagus]|uniref:F-box domain-containing protein n=1 Tax=Pristionchus entomophagus TaxID=358040 RepID=A0AAV5TIR9_9BILA|nr:hypothetical protein PENTCL1PPCAC_16404 [Pristionchus entomophagus]
MDEFSPEILKRIVKDFSLNDKLSLRAVSSRWNDYLLPHTPELIKPDECVIRALLLQKLQDIIQISARMHLNEIALFFVDVTNKATRHWKIKKDDHLNEDCRCFLKFPCMANSPRDFALFENTRIGHFRIYSNLPFPITPANLAWMKTMLTGCKEGKISLVVDAQTLSHIDLIPDLFTEVQASKLELLLQNTDQVEMLKPFCQGNFARELSRSSITEIEFIALKCSNLIDDDDCTDGNFELVEHLLAFGIRKITIDLINADDRNSEDIDRDLEFDLLLPFMKILCQSGQDVDIIIRNRKQINADFYTHPNRPCLTTSRLFRYDHFSSTVAPVSRIFQESSNSSEYQVTATRICKDTSKFERRITKIVD